MKRRQLIAAATAVLAAKPTTGLAQTKPLRIVVPFPAGGATDIAARALQEPLGRLLGQSVIIENRAGAGGSIGMAEVVKAAPDGNTLGVATLSTHGVNPAVYKKLSYDPMRDFVPVTEFVRAPGVLVVNAALPVKSFDEFLKYVKARPGQLSYASPGNGTIGHMWGELFKSTTNTHLVHIPYRGAVPALTDLMGNQVQVYFDQVTSSLPHIQAGRVKALAVAWSSRLPILREVPTFAERGLGSNNDASWFGLVAPVGTPADTARRLSAAVRAVVNEAALAAKLTAQGLYPSGTYPEQFGLQIRAEVDKMQRVARFAKILLD